MQTTRILCGSSVRTCIYCGGDMTVVDTVEQARRPFTPEGVSVVMRERVCKGGTNGRIGDGCGFRTFSEEHVVASVPPIPESENH